MAEDFFSVLRDRIVCGRRDKRNKKMKGFRERLRRMARKARLAENLRCFRKIPAWVCKQCIFRNSPVDKKI